MKRGTPPTFDQVRSLDEDVPEPNTGQQEQVERDVIGTDDIDPIRLEVKARRRPSKRQRAAATDGAVCIDCWEPIVPGAPTCVVIMGGVMPSMVHVDCDDPAGVEYFNCKCRLF